MWSMATMAVSEARERLSEAVETAHSEAVVLERYGRPAAVLLSPERYEQLLEAYEDAEDVSAFDEAMAEEGSGIPWGQVKTDLGWQ
jgi:antitoxin Phd